MCVRCDGFVFNASCTLSVLLRMCELPCVALEAFLARQNQWKNNAKTFHVVVGAFKEFQAGFAIFWVSFSLRFVFMLYFEGSGSCFPLPWKCFGAANSVEQQ